MSLESAPSVDEAGERECNVCETEGTFVIYDGDRVCTECGHAPTSDGETAVDIADDKWAAWFDHRRDEYSGWYGENRAKFVGGFVSVYDFGDDFYRQQ